MCIDAVGMEGPDSGSVGAVNAKGVPRGEDHEAREVKRMPVGQTGRPIINTIHDVCVCGTHHRTISTRVDVSKRPSTGRDFYSQISRDRVHSADGRGEESGREIPGRGADTVRVLEDASDRGMIRGPNV